MVDIQPHLGPKDIMLLLLLPSMLCGHWHVGAPVAYLVPESTGKLHMGAELDQGLLESQVLCMMQNR